MASQLAVTQALIGLEKERDGLLNQLAQAQSEQQSAEQLAPTPSIVDKAAPARIRSQCQSTPSSSPA